MVNNIYKNGISPVKERGVECERKIVSDYFKNLFEGCLGNEHDKCPDM